MRIETIETPSGIIFTRLIEEELIINCCSLMHEGYIEPSEWDSDKLKNWHPFSLSCINARTGEVLAVSDFGCFAVYRDRSELSGFYSYTDSPDHYFLDSSGDSITEEEKENIFNLVGSERNFYFCADSVMAAEFDRVRELMQENIERVESEENYA